MTTLMFAAFSICPATRPGDRLSTERGNSNSTSRVLRNVPAERRNSHALP